jgi:hypothetical protein
VHVDDVIADGRIDELADRYLEIRAFRSEALAKYKATELSLFSGPKPRVLIPKIRIGGANAPKKRLGPVSFYDNPPVLEFLERELERRDSVAILEIGPGGGELSRDLQARFGSKIRAYYGLDRDPTAQGAYSRVESVNDIPSEIDLVVAAEVIEHMRADDLFSSLLVPLRSKLAPAATFVLSIPNPTAPGGIGRDFSHVQRYPWYDLYALFRLAFRDVEVYRHFYTYEPKRLLMLVPRILLCWVLEMEWCDGLVCVASMPR